MSEKHPVATREDHDDFCLHEEWALVRGAHGQPVRHHRTYELPLWDGRILRTRISRPIDRTGYAASMWSHILREQLEVSADAFWFCVRKHIRPERGEPKPTPPRKSVPLHLVRELSRLGIPETEILELDAAEAAQRHAQLLAGQQTPPGHSLSS
ncbi:cytotoxic translational repressor of toxin-antitoxin stability system [Microbacterium soli]|uniref:Cytotoxic translational repressor of toxin-antitoxin stability system n=1 Tax=Microbacterium soli TaxID=446075 RepID=A0ABP7MSQ0_9MICO